MSASRSSPLCSSIFFYQVMFRNGHRDLKSPSPLPRCKSHAYPVSSTNSAVYWSHGGLGLDFKPKESWTVLSRSLLAPEVGVKQTKKKNLQSRPFNGDNLDRSYMCYTRYGGWRIQTCFFGGVLSSAGFANVRLESWQKWQVLGSSGSLVSLRVLRQSREC